MQYLHYTLICTWKRPHLYNHFCTFFVAFLRYLNMMGVLDFYPNQFTFCTLQITLNLTSNLCSTLFILNMTFDRFYGIIMPHKAASFNTVKRAKIIIICSIIFSIAYNTPHLFISSEQGGQCVPYGKAMKAVAGEVYYWLSYVTNFVLPFILLLIMNSFIIHTIRNRTKLNKSRSNNQGQGHDKQVFAILLLVTFGFLILTTPAYLFFIFNMFIDFTVSPKVFAAYHLFSNIAQKLHFTNHGINFFFYVISGQKFRTDLIKLFKREDASSYQTGTLFSISNDTESRQVTN